MSDDSEATSSLSPNATRWLWIIAGALSALALGLNVWDWIRKGRIEGAHSVNPLGILLLSIGSLIDPKHGILYYVFVSLALVCIITGVVLFITSSR